MFCDRSMNTNREECLKELEKGLNLVKSSKNDGMVSDGWCILKCLEENQKSMLKYIIGYDIIEELVLGPEPAYNYLEIPAMLRWCLRNSGTTGLPLQIRNNVLEVLQSGPSDLQFVVNVVNLLEEFPRAVPIGDNLVKLFEFIISVLSNCQMPRDSSLISQFLNNIKLIENFMCKVLKSATNKEEVLHCSLKNLYVIISQSEPLRDPCAAVAIVLQLVPPQHISKAVQTVLADNVNYGNISRVLSVLCNWLTAWPRTTCIKDWLDHLLDVLEAEEKFDLLNEIAFSKIESLFGCLKLSLFRPQVQDIVWRLIISTRHTNVTFHKIVGKIPELVFVLEKEKGSPSSKRSLIQLCSFTLALMNEFPDYTELYVPVINAFKSCSVYTLAEKVNLSKYKIWSHSSKRLNINIDVNSSLTRKGRIGLQNLGNTCYMNSVLQALFMTHKFYTLVLSADVSKCKPVMLQLQSLFARLEYSLRPMLAPYDILQVSRPSGFLPGQQQDSSEFLIHLLDVLHEEEKSSFQPQLPVSSLCSNEAEMEDETSMKSMSRWTTEEDLSTKNILERKASSLADFTEVGEVQKESLQLNNQLSVSADSGIHSVNDDEGNISPGSAFFESIIQRTYGGKLLITYTCLKCESSSVNTDPFTDLQLSFPNDQNEKRVFEVQELLDFYLSPEKLSGENSYKCEKCRSFTVGQRSVQILQAPSHLLLTLKHFQYDQETKQRIKLFHNVHYSESLDLNIALPVQQTAPSMETCKTTLSTETYKLYAAVVHSGRSVDSGHYYTFASDSSHSWFTFNDSFVSNSTLEELSNLKASDTPYILFYARIGESLRLPENAVMDINDLSPHLIEILNTDRREFFIELESGRTSSRNTFLRRNNDDDDDPPSLGGCGSGMKMGSQHNMFIC